MKNRRVRNDSTQSPFTKSPIEDRKRKRRAKNKMAKASRQANRKK